MKDNSLNERKIVFLDRDGTINVDKNYLFLKEEFEFLPGVIEGLRILQDAGFTLVVVTNQSGIARGMYTEEDFLQLDKWMKEKLEEEGICIWKTYYCPHLPGAAVKKYDCECSCRKPKTQLYYQAVEELAKDGEVNIAECYAIGDKMRDLSICKELKMRGFLIGSFTGSDVDDANIMIVDSLLSAAKRITENGNSSLEEM